jgi:hypothetical protein
MTVVIPTFKTTSFGTVHVMEGRYRNGSLALELLDSNGELIAALSVNLVDESPRFAPYEFAVKTWGENEELAADALRSGLFTDTGKRAGFIRALVWAANWK